MATKKGSAKPERGYIGRRWNPSWGEQYYLGESGPEGRPWGPANEENFALAVRFASRAEARLHFKQHRISGAKVVPAKSVLGGTRRMHGKMDRRQDV
jgi:hypothetical protein